LGEAVVSGTVSPDEYILDKCNKKVVEKHISEKVVMVVKNEEDIGTVEVRVSDFLGYDFINKQCLTEEEIDELAEYGIKIENIYENYEDIEWGFDKDTKKLYILQARPITTLKNRVKKEANSMGEKKELNVLTKGLSASPGIACGNVKNISNISEISRIEDGDVIVTVMTNPDMVPAMRRARAVVTDEGGRTCHAAIVSRELGIPCIVGTKTATETLKEGMSITVDATRGVVYEGKVFKKEKEEAEILQRMIMAELTVHMNKSKWG
jgi:pyruvate,water dikinase